MGNLKLAIRTLLKTPFVSLVAILSLALGIGANAAIFSLFDQMLRQPIPVHDPDRLVNLSAPGPMPGSNSCNQAGSCDEVFSYPMFRDLERLQTPFAGIAAHRLFGANVAFHNQTMNGQGLLVSGSYFPVLGVHAAIGRLFGPEDDRTIGGHYVAVLSHGYWESQLGSSPSVLGEQIVINGQRFTIVGVAPRGFEGTTLGGQPRVFVPLTMRGQVSSGWKGLTDRRNYSLYLFARLKPGVGREQALTAINAVFTPIIDDVEAPLQEGMSAQTMTKFRAKQVLLADGSRGQSSMHREARTPILLLFSITGIVLLIACANIANLLLARAANRSMEMAVRLSLGATRGQLLGQLLTESVMLAVFGGVVSLIVARWTLGTIAAMLPGESAQVLHFQLHASAVLFAAVLSLGTGFLFGLFPALHSTRPDLVTTLRANSGKTAGHRSAARFRSSLVTAQIALSMALLISAGLFIKSLRNVSRVDLGIKADDIVTFGISPELNGYSAERSRAFFQRVEEELGAQPGVTGVTEALVPLLAGDNWGNDVAVEGFRKGPDTDANARFNMIGTAFFHTLGVPLLAGREFTVSDGLGTPRVAIVNEAFARKFGLGRNAVGKRMGFGRKQDLEVEIVGLVQDAKYSQVKDQIPPQFFVPYRQDSTVGNMTFYARTSRDPQQVLRAIPRVVKQLDADLPVENLKSMPQQVRENVFLDRMIGTLSAAFAALATLLAAIGLYGVLAYTVAQRTREIGVRMALGAEGRHVRGMVLRQVGRMTLVGGAVGIAAALGLGKAAQSLLFGLEATDPLVMALAATVLMLVALGAGYVPARRASKIDPMQALRYE